MYQLFQVEFYTAELEKKISMLSKHVSDMKPKCYINPVSHL
jgi:hypothetical protein